MGTHTSVPLLKQYSGQLLDLEFAFKIYCVCVQDGAKYQYESSEIERLHFVKFETKYIEQWLDFIRNHLVFSKESMEGKSIKATGGGAYKYSELIQQKLGLTWVEFWFAVL